MTDPSEALPAESATDLAHARFVKDQISKAERFAHSEPEVALAQARKAAEAICRHLFTRSVGEPGRFVTLDTMLQKLNAARSIPPRILVPLGTVQAYGNYGAHAQADLAQLQASYVRPCLAALEEIAAWYFGEWLSPEVLKDLQASPTPPRAPEFAASTPGIVRITDASITRQLWAYLPLENGTVSASACRLLRCVLDDEVQARLAQTAGVAASRQSLARVHDALRVEQDCRFDPSVFLAIKANDVPDSAVVHRSELALAPGDLDAGGMAETPGP